MVTAAFNKHNHVDMSARAKKTRDSDMSLISENLEDGGGGRGFKNAVETLHVDWFAGLLLSVALYTEGTLSSMEHHYVLGASFKFLGVLQVVLAFGFYFYRVFTNSPNAGKSAYLFLTVPFILCLACFGVWSAVLSILDSIHHA